MFLVFFFFFVFFSVSLSLEGGWGGGVAVVTFEVQSKNNSNKQTTSKFEHFPKEISGSFFRAGERLASVPPKSNITDRVSITEVRLILNHNHDKSKIIKEGLLMCLRLTRYPFVQSEKRHVQKLCHYISMFVG